MKKKEIKKAIEDRISTLKTERDILKKYDIEQSRSVDFAVSELQKLLKECFPTCGDLGQLQGILINKWS